MHFPEEKRSISSLCSLRKFNLTTAACQSPRLTNISNLCSLSKTNLTIAACQSPRLTNQKLQKSGHQVDSSCISSTRTPSQYHHRTQANMSNLEDMLNYLRPDSLPTTYDFSAHHSVALHSDSSSLFTKLFLVGLTAMIIFTVAASWDLGQQVAQRLQSGDLFAALEDIQMDMESQVSSVPRPGIEGRILPITDLPALDENDNFMLPPPAYEP